MTPCYIEVIVSIGSNCGNREANVKNAIEWLSEHGLSDMRNSYIYETPDCMGGQSKYLNAVCVGLIANQDGKEQELSKLTQCFKKYELSCGRDATARADGQVPIDIDIVKADDEILRERDFKSEFFLIGYRELYKDARLDSMRRPEARRSMATQ